MAGWANGCQRAAVSGLLSAVSYQLGRSLAVLPFRHLLTWKAFDVVLSSRSWTCRSKSTSSYTGNTTLYVPSTPAPFPIRQSRCAGSDSKYVAPGGMELYSCASIVQYG